jgi:phosphoadenosine phosphosulfate reductase
MNIGLLEAVLGRVADHYSPAVLASSLSVEDMVLTDAIARHALPIEVFVLDTGRLHADTLSLIQETQDRYGIAIRVYEPDPLAVQGYVNANGRDAFYSSVELRKRCCEIRKVEPLKRALAGKRAWITGLRREHSPGRVRLAEHELDAVHGLDKFNPLSAWSEDEVWAYIKHHKVPYNRLYDQGYRSIGCAPCTRPVLLGEDVRAGRWWWELPETKECGLHIASDGRVARAKKAA